MHVADTKLSEKCCSKCGLTKQSDEFIKNRNICKVCRNKRSRELYGSNKVVEEMEDIQNTKIELKECNVCKIQKPLSDIVKGRIVCKECNNNKRRNKYHTDEDHRQNLIKMATEFKHNKMVQRLKEKENKLGKENKECNYCHKIKHMSNFRYNRLKCKICERDDPVEKFKRTVRCRIYLSIKKDKHTIEYLGCTSSEYLNWLLYNGNDYTLENRGQLWHIDHVIPLSKFNLEDKEEQLIAFNWRNTMPLSVKENLSKNNKILKPQVEQHFKLLSEYHIKNNIEMPEKFISLFAKHLVAGTPLELSLPLTNGNICKELG